MRATALGKPVITPRVVAVCSGLKERDLGIARREFPGRLEPLGRRSRPEDSIVRVILLPQVALNGAEHDRVVIHGKNDGLGHYGTSVAAAASIGLSNRMNITQGPPTAQWALCPIFAGTRA